MSPSYLQLIEADPINEAAVALRIDRSRDPPPLSLHHHVKDAFSDEQRVKYNINRLAVERKGCLLRILAQHFKYSTRNPERDLDSIVLGKLKEPIVIYKLSEWPGKA